MKGARRQRLARGGRRRRLCHGLGAVLGLEAEDALGLPNLEEGRQRHQRHDGRGDVRQLGADVVGREELHQCERAAAHQHGGPGFLDAAPAVHDGHEPEQHDHGHERQLAPGHLADGERIHARNLPRHDDRNAHGAKGHRRRVGDQAQAGRIQRLEAQAHQQGSRNGHGRAEARRALQERAEAKAHQDELQPLVGRHRQDGRADDVELSRLDRNFVEEHRRHDDPGDGPQAVEEAVHGRGQRRAHRHLVEQQRHAQGQQHRDGAGLVALETQPGQRKEEEDDGNERDQGRDPDVPGGVVVLLPEGLHGRCAKCVVRAGGPAGVGLLQSRTAGGAASSGLQHGSCGPGQRLAQEADWHVSCSGPHKPNWYYQQTKPHKVGRFSGFIFTSITGLTLIFHATSQLNSYWSYQ